MPTKKYLNQNVYDAAKKRIAFIFKNFKKIYISFSGGKDSGVMLNLVIDHMRAHKIKKKVGVLFIDMEGQYKLTIDYTKSVLEKNADLFEIYWVCLPINLRNAVSVFQPFWTPWDLRARENWIREYPDFPGVITEENNPFPFFRRFMEFEKFVPAFGKWYSGGEKTACLVGIRSDESLNRFRTIASRGKAMLSDLNWTTRIAGDEELYNCYPIYDWRTEDVWIANAKNDWEYNPLYDLYYKAGVPLSAQRICQPYGDDQRAGLSLFRVIEPETWARVVNRVSGANFGNIYSGNSILGYRKVKLPKGHSWRSYTKLLLASLPKTIADNYRGRFVKFILYWKHVGSVVPPGTILPKEAVLSERISNRGRFGRGRPLVRYIGIPDSIPSRLEAKRIAPTWRRMAICILKNDHLCRSLSFSQTKYQRDRMRALLEKYGKI
jgi:predicted phosphoadenosine phosphosulfate sulfurtransferase